MVWRRACSPKEDLRPVQGWRYWQLCMKLIELTPVSLGSCYVCFSFCEQNTLVSLGSGYVCFSFCEQTARPKWCPSHTTYRPGASIYAGEIPVPLPLPLNMHGESTTLNEFQLSLEQIILPSTGQENNSPTPQKISYFASHISFFPFQSSFLTVWLLFKCRFVAWQRGLPRKFADGVYLS